MKGWTLDRRFVARILIIVCMLAGFVPCALVPIAGIVLLVSLSLVGSVLGGFSLLPLLFGLMPPFLIVVQVFFLLALLGLSVILLMTAIGGLRFRWWAWCNIVVFGLLVLVLTGLELFAFTVSRIPVAVIVFYIVLFTAALYFFISPKTVRLFSPTEEGNHPASTSHRLRPINIVTFTILASLVLVPVALLFFLKISLVVQNRDDLIDKTGTRFSNVSAYEHLFDADCVERTIGGVRLKLPRGYAVYQVKDYPGRFGNTDITLIQNNRGEKRFPMVCDIGREINQAIIRLHKGTLRGERNLYESSWNLSVLLHRWFKFFEETVFEYEHAGMSGFIKMRTHESYISYSISVYRGTEHYIYDVDFVVYDSSFDERFISYFIANLVSSAEDGRDSFENGTTLFGHGSYQDAQFAFLDAFGDRHDTESLYMLARSMFHYFRTQPLFITYSFDMIEHRILDECPNHEGALELQMMIKAEDGMREKRRIEERAREKAATWHPFH